MSASHLKAAGLKDNTGLDCGMEDELSAPLMSLRNTPRSALAAIVRKPSTPQRHASSVGAPPAHAHVAANTPNTSRIRRPLAEKDNPSTAHTLRALQQRRATPGRDRRRSRRLQRETPRDALRNLSKVLASNSQITKTSPQPLPQESSTWVQTAKEKAEDDLDLLQPRFLLAVDDEANDDDSFGQAPPRLSMPFEDGEQTGRSVEVARHVTNEGWKGRPLRGSFGSVGLSDRFSNVSASGTIDLSLPSMDDSIVEHPVYVDAHGLENLELRLDVGDETKDVRRGIFGPSDTPNSHPSRVLDTRNLLETDTHSPFLLNISQFHSGDSSPEGVPQRSVSPEEQQHGGQETDSSDTQNPRTPRFSKADATIKPRLRRPKTLERARHVTPYPSLPTGVTKNIVTSFFRKLGGKQTRISRETLGALMEAGDQYFQQLGGDLSVFANHAGRKKIDRSDVFTVMKRQRHLSTTATPFSLAQNLFPAELLRDLHLPVPKGSQQPKKRHIEIIDEDEEDADE